MITYFKENVFEMALKRIEYIFDEFDNKVIICMSGGKDSTVIFELATMVADRRHCLPLRVFWLDQEVEWRRTVDYMRNVFYNRDVIPMWYQIPFLLTNSLSFIDNYLYCWDPKKEKEWIRPKDKISIKENPLKENRFHPLMRDLVTVTLNHEKNAMLVGMRVNENIRRRFCITAQGAKYKGISWCARENKDCYAFYPIYDFKDEDVWTAIAKNNWEYNKIYDYFYQYGLPKAKFRVSSLIHETAYESIYRLQEVEPEIYDAIQKRISGVSTFNHLSKDINIYKLPDVFSSWVEYRDYLLDKLIKDDLKPIFVRRFSRQLGEDWAREHIQELLVNDIDGTKNANAIARIYKSKNKEKEREIYEKSCK